MTDSTQGRNSAQTPQNAAEFAAAMAHIGSGPELLTNASKLRAAVTLAQRVVVQHPEIVNAVIPDALVGEGAARNWNPALDMNKSGMVSQDELAVSLVIEAAVGQPGADGIGHINASNLMLNDAAKAEAEKVACGCRLSFSAAEVTRFFGARRNTGQSNQR